MRTRTLYIAITMLLAAGLIPTRAARADNYPYHGRAGYTVDATVTTVDPGRDRLEVDGDNGHHYTVDTSNTAIALRGTDRPGETGDLVIGMHIHLTGTLLSSDIIEADQLNVLPIRTSRPTGPVAGRTPRGQSFDNTPTGSINLRGTVVSVDNPRAAFVVRIKQRQRTVFAGDDTQFSTPDPRDTQGMPLRIGDRVSVVGILRADGTVLASTVRAGTSLAGDPSDDTILPPTLTGRITSESSRFGSRDIKIRLSSGREIKIIVPRNIPVRRNGQPVSIHELTKEDIVHVSGAYDGDDFRATRIECGDQFDIEP